MSLLAHEERDIENMQADFDVLIAKEDWKGAQAIIDNLRDLGQEHSADILRKAYLKAQYESKKDWDNEGKFNEERREADHSEWMEQWGASYLD